MKVMKWSVPLLVALDETSGNNTNLPFVAFYSRHHANAASLAMQELREAEANVLAYAVGLTVGAAAALGSLWQLGYLALLPLHITALAVLIGALLGALGTALVPGRAKRVNALGEAAECAADVLIYALPVADSMIMSARSLARHYGWPSDDAAYAELVRLWPEAKEWVRARLPLALRCEAARDPERTA